MSRLAAVPLLLLLLIGWASYAPLSEGLLQGAKSALRDGEVASAVRKTKIGLNIAALFRDKVLEWRFRLIFCEASLLDHRPAETLVELRKPFPASPEFAKLAGRRKMLEGAALFAMDDYGESGAAWNAAHNLAEMAHDSETLCDIEIRQGSRLLDQSEWDAAENTLNSALSRARLAMLPYQEAGALLDLGASRLDRYRYDEGIGYFQQAAKIVSPLSVNLYSVARANLAECYYNLGEFDRATDILREAIAKVEKGGAKIYLERDLRDIGHAYELKGDQQKAAESLVRALKVAIEIGRERDAADSAGNLANVYSALGEWDQAEFYNQESIRIKRSLSMKSDSEDYNRFTSAGIAVGRGRFLDADQQYRHIIGGKKTDPELLWNAYGELGRSLMLQGRPKDAIPSFEAAVVVVEKKRAELLYVDSQLPFLTRLIRLYQSYVDAFIAQGDFDGALAVADSSKAQALSGRFDSALVRRRSAAPFVGIARKTGATVVAYWLRPQHSYAWVISPRGVHHVTLAGEREIAELIDQYSDSIQRNLSDPQTTRIPSGEKLYHLLIEPLNGYLPAGSQIVIVPDGALSALNFETLPVPGAAPPRYWIEDVKLAVAPSVSVLDRGTFSPVAKRDLLVIGNPETGNASLPPLPSAPVEIANITRHYSANSRRVYEKADAVPQAYRNSNPIQFNAIHFTAHAIASRDSALDSAIYLTGGNLYAREVQDIPLHATLVTISACRGIGSRTYQGEGLVGFAWAFLRAGAHNVIAGLWDVDDQSTAQLMDVFYDGFSAGKSPAEALRAAKLALIRSGGNFRKPYYWGAFQLYTVGPM